MNPRYKVQLVGGGHDLWVVIDTTKGHYASAHTFDNWVAWFKDDLEGLKLAKAKADELNGVVKP